ncbi:MAG: hypothetical protein ABIN91_23400 [Mucilaginibacter sp.]|uniref:hypothetical protein n=1 Tax=Mucilaginibacter sp. TaxID=1882438 RepID=UPI0032639A4E
MKKILVSIAFAVVLAGCSNRPQQNNVSIESNTTAGFDVNKLGDMVKTSTDPQVLEKAINDPKNNINNLDLDKNGSIDYLKVTEPGKNQLAVVDDISKDQSVTVASINVNPTDNNSADLNIQGNPSYVGDNYMYHSHFGLGEILLLSYMLRPHPYYMPMYHYGAYPASYTSRRVVSNYRPTTSSAVSSPRRSFSGSSSQRSFGTRSSGSGVRSGGFGSSRRSSGFSSGSSSRRSFGSSRSFGRRR